MARKTLGRYDTKPSSSAVAVAPDAVDVAPEAVTHESSKDLVYTFRISRRAAPIEFRNLWELAFKGPNDREYRIEIDADMLSTVITRINYIFEQDGL